MPLQTLSLSLTQQWQLFRTNVGFGNTIQGSDNKAFSWATNATLTTSFNQLFANEYLVWNSGATPTGVAASLVSGGTLTVSQAYFYKVTATFTNTDGTVAETQGSAEVTVTPTTGNQTAHITWTALTGSSGYKVYRGTTTGAENLLVGTITSGSTVSFNDTGFAGSSASPPGATPTFVEFGLYSFTNLVNEAVTALHVLGLLVLPTGTGATCVLSPGTTNGLTWFFGGTTPTHNAPINGCFFHSEDPSGTGQALSSGSNTLRITNGGSGPLTAIVLAPVSTS